MAFFWFIRDFRGRLTKDGLVLNPWFSDIKNLQPTFSPVANYP